MRHFFDPSLLPVKTIDIEGKILYTRTNGLHYYGYPDIVFEGSEPEGELLLLDILDRIYSLQFDINSTWNYNGKLFKLEIKDDGLAYINYCKVDQPRIITILNAQGKPAKYISKGLIQGYGHPEAEVEGETLNGKDILSYLIDQVISGTHYDEDTLIICEDNVYSITYGSDRLGNPLLQIQLNEQIYDKPKTRKRGEYLKRIK